MGFKNFKTIYDVQAAKRYFNASELGRSYTISYGANGGATLKKFGRVRVARAEGGGYDITGALLSKLITENFYQGDFVKLFQKFGIWYKNRGLLCHEIQTCKLAGLFRSRKKKKLPNGTYEDWNYYVDCCRTEAEEIFRALGFKLADIPVEWKDHRVYTLGPIETSNSQEFYVQEGMKK
jgi:hypothetical protein